MYKLYTDKNENFECEVSVKNASLKGSLARLVVESENGLNLVFHGKIEGEKCVIPVRRLKGLLDENTRGKMHLEVIVEDTYFNPWKSEFIVEEHTSVKVKIAENKQSSKPIIQVRVPFKETKKASITSLPLKEISDICNKFGINKGTIKKRKNDFFQIIKEYFNSNPEFKPLKVTILGGLKRSLQ
jgi:hypothetical protein